MRKLATASLLFFTAFSFLAPSSAFAAPQDINGAGANCGADCVAEGVIFTTDHTLTIDDDAAVGNTAGASFNPGADNFGTVAVNLDTDISGTVGTAAADSINQINIANAGTDLTLSADVWLNGDIDMAAATQSIILEAGVDIDTTAAQSITNSSGAAAGTLTIQGASTFTGGVGATGVGALTLITIGGAATTSTFGNGTATDDVFATTLNFGANGTAAFATLADFTGAITTSTTNTGTLTLSGTNVITGAVGASGAVLSTINVGANGTTSSFSSTVFATTINITGDATNVTFSGDVTGALDFDAGSDPTAVTFADNSDLTGAVTITTAGQGQLTFAGTSTVSGAIGTNANFINTITTTGGADTVTFGGNVFAIDVTVVAGDTLNIGANTIDLVEASGDGDFLLADVGAGTLALTITNATTFGNIQATGATGTADIEAADALTITINGAVPNGQTFAIVNSTNDTIAAVPGTITDNSIFYSFAATEPTAGDLVLTATLNTANVATTADTSNTLTSINNALANSPGADLQSVANTLYALTTAAQVTTALETMAPDVNAGNTAASFASANAFVGTVNAHLAETRGAAGVSTGDPWIDAGFWVKGFGTSADQDARDGIAGYDADVFGGAAGVDWVLAKDWRLGLAGGYASSEIDNDGDTGGTDIDGYQGTVYVGYDNPSPWYLNGGFAFGWNEYDGSRPIAVGTISRVAISDYSGQQYTGYGDMGYVFEYKPNANRWPLEITPLASLTYSHLEVDGYTETGAADLNLTVADQSYDFLQSGLGVKLAMPIKDASGKWTPEIHARWLYDFIGDEVQTTSTFTGGGASFRTTGAEPAQHSVNVGAGLTFYSKSNITLSGVYDFEFKDDYTAHNGQVVFRYNY